MTILNMLSPNNRGSNYVRQKLVELQGELEESTIRVGDWNTPFSDMDRPSRQKISRDIDELNRRINQLDTHDIYRLLHPKTAEHRFLSSLRGTVAKTDHAVGYKPKLSN